MPNGIGRKSLVPSHQRAGLKLRRAPGNSIIHLLVMLVAITFSHRSPAAPVSKASATTAAHGWLEERSGHLATRIHRDIKSVDTYPNFHVVHLEPEGYMVVAADDDMEPVLAFGDRGDFKPDANNTLWIMLNQDVPSQMKHLRDVRNRPAKSTKPQANGEKEDEAITAAKRANAKWEQFKHPIRRATADQPTSGPTTLSLSDQSTDIPTTPVNIVNFGVVDGHVQLTHDCASSVSVYSSYDQGATWQLEDSGIVWPSWSSRRQADEDYCWYRIAADGVYDEMAVSLFRNPTPGTPVVDSTMTNLASDPGLSGSLNGLSDVRVAPIVQSTWNQSTEQGQNCYNFYTPNNFVDGCVATCMAQLMRYWQYPKVGIGQVSQTVYVSGSGQTKTTRGGDGVGGAYTWTQMPLSPSTASYNSSQWQMIGSLCYDAGVSVNMQYSSSGSGAYMYLCANALTRIFRYTNAVYMNYPPNAVSIASSAISGGYPVLLGISHSGTSGHAVVCDGFGYDSGTLYFHINFGWDGAYNAWYAMPNLETPYSFNSIDTIIYNIFPTKKGELITGRILTPQGAPIPGVTVNASAHGTNYTATSDSKGYYGIVAPSSDTYLVTASKAGLGNASRSGVATRLSSNGGAFGNTNGINFTMSYSFSFSAVALTNCVWLRWAAPTNSGFANNTVYIRSRTDHYPTGPSDGSLIYTGSAQVYQDNSVNVTGSVTNYYTIWCDNSGSYASPGIATNCFAAASPGNVRMIWTGAGGEVSFRNLKTTGLRKSGGYVSSTLLDTTYWKVSGFNDIDGDGTADILWTGAGHEVNYWLLNMDGTLKSSGSVTPGVAPRSGSYIVVGFGDLNGDGTADILWMGPDNAVSYWMMNADGTRKSSGLCTPGVSPRTGSYVSIGCKDIDGDGVMDVVWMGTDGTVSYWMMNADGTRKSAGYVTPGVAPRSGKYTAAGFGDVDGDGVPDIIWVGADGTVSYWLLNSNGTRKSSGLVSSASKMAPPYWTPAGFQDVDGDGKPDILWRGQGGETICWFLNAGGTLKSTANIDPNPVSATYWKVSGVGTIGGN